MATKRHAAPGVSVAQSGKRLLTRDQVGEILGCSPHTVDRYSAEGRLARVQFGGRGAPSKFDPADVDAFIAAHRDAGNTLRTA